MVYFQFQYPHQRPEKYGFHLLRTLSAQKEFLCRTWTSRLAERKAEPVQHRADDVPSAQAFEAVHPLGDRFRPDPRGQALFLLVVIRDAVIGRNAFGFVFRAVTLAVQDNILPQTRFVAVLGGRIGFADTEPDDRDRTRRKERRLETSSGWLRRPPI